MKRKPRIETAVERTAREHPRSSVDRQARAWARILRTGVVICAVGLFGLASLATAQAFEAFKGARF